MVIFLAVTAVFTFIQPLKYEADSKLIVVQNLGGTIVDQYTASKSNEYLSSILAKVVSSENFFNDVMVSGFNIDKNYFSERSDEKMKMWEKTVYAGVISDTGIITISVFHPDKYQLGQIARAVNYILKTKNGQYHGGGDGVNVKIINEPIISNWPTKPNFILNFGMALVLGLIVGFNYVYLFPETNNDVGLWPSFFKKSKEAGTTDEDLDRIAGIIANGRNNYDEKISSVHPENIGGGYADEAIDMDDNEDEDISKRGDMKNILG